MRHGAMAPVPFDELYARAATLACRQNSEDLVRHKAGVSEARTFRSPARWKNGARPAPDGRCARSGRIPMLAPDPEAANRFLLEQFGVPL
ncbi:MAG: hypothetical protein R3F17_16570 [Planctomycetota bacterium]